MKYFKLVIVLLFIAMLSGCGGEKKPGEGPAHRGIYHWKTTYDPSEWELQWMKKHKVDRLYVRLFDVEPGADNGYDDWSMVPVATTRFNQALPEDIDVVPVVYITVDAIRALEKSTDYCLSWRYAKMLVDRIESMMAAHWDGELREVQLDCDWTSSTRAIYFELCHEVKERLSEKNIILSGTLRLHQLNQVGPRGLLYGEELPFDRLLLMCYNTGRLQDLNTENSILDFNDVKPYLDRYHYYNLPNCDMAYPIYGWGVVFDEQGNFVKLINSHHLTPLPDSIDGWMYVRKEWGRKDDIVKTQKALPELDSEHTTILFHLDSLNLANYRYEDIETFYSR